jgi:hypothetical protein
MTDHLHQQGDHIPGIGQGASPTFGRTLGLALLELLLAEEVDKGARDPCAAETALGGQSR